VSFVGITGAYAVAIYWKKFAWDLRQGLFDHEKNGDYPFYPIASLDDMSEILF